MPLPRPLTPLEVRVLGTLMEKARTVPDTYPLSLNLVVTGCNQKTSREPVMRVTEADAQAALDDLKSLSLVIESHGSRVARYEHNFQRVLGVPEQSAVLLGLLMLRGPQTAGELRINADRWYRFADTSSVQGFLDELAATADEQDGALVVQLARGPGERETRWAHTLAGPVAAAADGRADLHTSHDAVTLEKAPSASTTARLEALELEVAQLRSTVQRLCDELGLPSTAARDAVTGEAAADARGAPLD